MYDNTLSYFYYLITVHVWNNLILASHHPASLVSHEDLRQQIQPIMEGSVESLKFLMLNNSHGFLRQNFVSASYRSCLPENRSASAGFTIFILFANL